MYKIIIERKASKEIENLPNDVIQRIADAIKNLGYNPRPRNSKKLITIYRVKHRKEAYR